MRAWFAVCVVLVLSSAAHAEPKDPALAPRFPDAELRKIVRATETNGIVHGADGEWVFKPGDHAEILYRVKPGTKVEDILAHYEKAWTAAGGQLKWRGKTKEGEPLVVMDIDQPDHSYRYEVVASPKEPFFTIYEIVSVKDHAKPEWSLSSLNKKLDQRGMTLLYQKIEFTPDGALVDTSARHLAPIAKVLEKQPGWNLEMLVRTPDAKEKKLVAKRAKAIAAWFAAQNVTPERIKVEGVVVKPADPNAKSMLDDDRAIHLRVRQDPPRPPPKRPR